MHGVVHETTPTNSWGNWEYRTRRLYVPAHAEQFLHLQLCLLVCAYLYGSAAAEHPHEITEVSRCHCLIKSNSQLGGREGGREGERRKSEVEISGQSLFLILAYL